ncbi:MAG: hypothetical protein AB1750_16700 [Chloroflexota bacterium]
MNKPWLKDKNALTIGACMVALLLIYSINIFRLAYLLAPWESFGETSVVPARLLYFVNDTPDIIGYAEKDTGQRVECAEAVAYLGTDSGETYRCCQAERRVSCVAGDFASDIPPADPACAQTLSETFGVPASLAEARDYQIYGACPDSGPSELTVAKINAEGQIKWKSVSLFGPSLVSGALRCLLAPALLAYAIWTFVNARRKPDPDRQIRKW